MDNIGGRTSGVSGRLGTTAGTRRVRRGHLGVAVHQRGAGAGRAAVVRLDLTCQVGVCDGSGWITVRTDGGYLQRCACLMAVA